MKAEVSLAESNFQVGGEFGPEEAAEHFDRKKKLPATGNPAALNGRDSAAGLTRWVRLRLRAALWRQWKTPRRRRAALLKLGVRPQLASNTAGSSRGAWYLARAKALSVGLPNAYFKSLGLPSLAEEG